MLTGCSMTKNIPDGDQLFTGLKDIKWQPATPDSTISAAVMTRNMEDAQLEAEAALATAPNGSLFGSSFYRMPFSIGVSIWNHFSESHGMFAKWLTKSFGKQPVLMSWVNPELRAQVAQGVMRNHGYFGATVSHEVVAQKNPKTAKISYSINPGQLYTLDSISYIGFPLGSDTLIQQSLASSYLRKGDAFVVSNLDAERNRINTLLRNNGYYFYQPGYASYLADTFAVDKKVQLRFQMVDGTPEAAKHPWYIGRVNINMRKSYNEQYTDSLVGRFFTIRYSGKRPPIRPRALMADMKLRPRQMYSYDNYLESVNKINAMGLFSMSDFAFTPRDTTALCDTLDLTLSCTFDKPWDFYIETDFNARTIGRLGPEVRMGVTRRNAFRGGEKIDINVHGSYEWSTRSGSSMNNYEYGADGSVEFPRIIAPFVKNSRIRRDKDGRIVRRKGFYSTPTTMLKASTDIIYRPGYYKMHVVSGELTYRWQTSAQSRHELSPLTVKYQFMNSSTSDFENIMSTNPYLLATMQDYFIPEMRYTYTYTSPANLRNPIRWETTVSESGNGVALYDVLCGKKWNDKDKQMFKNPYSQFVKVETDFTKTWTFDSYSKLVAHINAGLIYYYGNSNWLPNSEMFYVGGANSIRAFPVRSIGPGCFEGFDNMAYSYLIQNGDTKVVANLEYRRKLFGDLYGALFLDAGNVWYLQDDHNGSAGSPSVQFRLKSMLTEMAVGTGLGLRYDLEFLVLRLDWGIGLHVPYKTERHGFYNVDGFKKNQTLNFAIGYPF